MGTIEKQNEENKKKNIHKKSIKSMSRIRKKRIAEGRTKRINKCSKDGSL